MDRTSMEEEINLLEIEQEIPEAGHSTSPKRTNLPYRMKSPEFPNFTQPHPSKTESTRINAFDISPLHDNISRSIQRNSLDQDQGYDSDDEAPSTVLPRNRPSSSRDSSQRDDSDTEPFVSEQEELPYYVARSYHSNFSLPNSFKKILIFLIFLFKRMKYYLHKIIYQIHVKDKILMKLKSKKKLDEFLIQIYQYYLGKGFYCILLSRFLNFLALGFLIFFTFFLFNCVDYENFSNQQKLNDLVKPQCFRNTSHFKLVILIIFILIWLFQSLLFLLEIPKLLEMKYFYQHFLKVAEIDLQTIKWNEIIKKLILLNQKENFYQIFHKKKVYSKLNIHDLTNRIMRQENYLIAIYNKNVLDFNVPFIGNQPLTKILEWNLSFCILNYVFDEYGQIRKKFLKEVYREPLTQGLRRRFLFMGLLNLLFVPLIVIFLIVYFFFRYFEEFYKNPSSISSRHFTPLARWKFREFNELPHQFDKRLKSANQKATDYLNHFPKEKTVILARFVSFITGSLAAVLILLTFFEHDFEFEITPGKTAWFYIGIFGSILAVSRGLIPQDNLVFEPAVRLMEVVEETHHLPEEWKDRLHTDEVRREFEKHFQMEVLLFLNEIFSAIVTPYILCCSLPKSSQRIIDFFREFSVHVDAVGYVCSFAVFDFRRNGNFKYGAPSRVENDYFVSKAGKMEQSFVNFKLNNPEWEPMDAAGSMYLHKINHLNMNLNKRGLLDTSTRLTNLDPGFAGASHSLHQGNSLNEEPIHFEMVSSEISPMYRSVYPDQSPKVRGIFSLINQVNLINAGQL